MLVTFIIVAYNAEKYLKESLNSLLAQDYNHQNIEVILVDSESTDTTKQLMTSFKEKEKNNFYRIEVLENPKKTLPCGWNVALKETTGEAIVRVDAHSIFPENFITENVKEIESGENIVGGKCISITRNNTSKEKLLLIAEESIFGAGIADFRRKEKREYVSTLAFAMYRKKVFDTVGFYNEALARTEDNEMHYRMKKAGYRFLLSPNIQTFRYARSDLKSMIKQKYGNGKWIGITMQYCPKCFSIYHFVPFVFFISILFSIFMCLMNIPIFAILLGTLYSIFNIANICFISIKEGFHINYLLLPIIFFVLHISYGWGTLLGLIRGPIYKKKKEKCK